VYAAHLLPSHVFRPDDFNIYRSHSGCLNAANGHTVWAVPTGGKKQEFQSSSPAYYNGKVIFGNVGGMVVAVDAVSGSKVWTFKTADEIYSSAKVGPLSSAPDSKYIVTIGSDDGNLYGACRQLSLGFFQLNHEFFSSILSSGPGHWRCCVERADLCLCSWLGRIHHRAEPEQWQLDRFVWLQ
jgi:hypothetical protein